MVIVSAEVFIRPELKSTLGGFKEHEICTAELVGAQVKLTVRANPFSAVTVTVEVPCAPGAEALLSRASKAKSGAGVAVTQALIRFVTSGEPSPVT